MAKLSLFDQIRNYIKGKSAERLEGWRKTGELKEDEVNKLYDEFDETLKTLNPHMNVNATNIDKILKSGEFKNQFQTHTSNGSFDIWSRAFHTERHFGTPANEKAYKESEKYGWLKDNVGMMHSPKCEYGEYTIDFKPSVKERMTAHIGDSLGSEASSFIPGDRSTYAMMMQSPSVNSNMNPYQMNSFLQDIPLADRGRYLEAQFHGPLSTGDIKAIRVDRNNVTPYAKQWSTNNYVPLYDENGCYNACFDVAGNRIME